MARPVLMPKPGQMTEECTLSLWRAAVGDPVRRGDVLFEIETDKSTMEVEAFDEGVLLAQVVAEGETVPVNAVCGWIGQPGEAIPDGGAPAGTAPVAAPAGTAPAGTAPTPAAHAPAAAEGAGDGARGAPAPLPSPAPPVRGGGRRPPVSPRARRLAREAGVDPASLRGTGPGGRVVERDVRAAAGPGGAGRPADGVARPLSRMRRVIAERLAESWRTAPHFTVTVAVDASRLTALRERLKASGDAPTVTDFVLAAAAATLAEHPDLNARTDGVSVWPRDRVHLGVAVSVPGGLVVPVVRDADTLSVAEIHDRVAALAAAARAGTASPDDLTGSTFTVSSLGMFGVEEFSAIINPGESAILAVSAALPTPVAVGGRVEVRPVMRLTLSADHRLVDGAEGARFMRALQERLEAPDGLRLGAPPEARPRRPRRLDDPDWFDVVVLGAGVGGYSAAFRAAQLGLRVALVDEDRVGGTCLHRGCVPTKAILEAADLAHRTRERGALLGVLADGVRIDYAATAAHRDAAVARLWEGLRGLVRRSGVEWVAGRGRLDGPSRVAVALGDGATRTLAANDVILATGSRPRELPGLAPDGRRVVTSDHALAWDRLPSRLVVIGAGAVGCEFASAFHDLGAEVTLLEYLPALVPGEDAEVSRELRRSFERRGIRVITDARFDASAVVVREDGVSITAGPDGGERSEIRADAILVAAGRAPRTEGIGLETTSVALERGFARVDGLMRTAEPHVWAVGDIAGGLLLAHTAAREGIVAAHAIAGEADVRPMDYTAQPRATYTRPEIASVGLTEAQCAERGLPVAVGRVPFGAVARAVASAETEGFAKVIAHAETGAVLGVHLIGPHATELIGEASLAAELGATADRLGEATRPHPSLSEILGEAALAVRRRSINS